MIALAALSCGEQEEARSEGFSLLRRKAEVVARAPEERTEIPASRRVDLTSKGVGPVQSLSLGTRVDAAMSNHGERMYDRKCLACHRMGKKSIGPALNGILDRRTPEWVMNILLNPELMVREDPLARDLFMEYNMSPMADQGLSHDQARAVLEYLRSID